MALTKITPQMFDTSATAHDLNVDNGTFVVDGSASRVGIGTATPSALLDVNGILTVSGGIGIGTNSPSGITNGKFLEIKNTSTGTGTHAQITLTGSNGHTNLLLASRDDTTGGDPVLSSTTNHAIRFGHSTNSTFAGFSEHMRIDSAGNIGIGTSTPSTLLDVNGTATATTFVGALTGNVTGTILTAAQTNITSLGTLSALTVTGTSTLGVVDASSFTDVITNTIYTQSGNLDIDTVLTGRDVTFTQGSTALMTIKGDASGTTVTGTLTGSDILLNDSGNNERSLRIQNSTVSSYLGVEGSSANRFVGSAANNMFLGTTTADGIEFATNNNVRAVIDSSGKIGIGITSGMDRDLHIKGSGSDVGIQIEKTGAAELRVAVDSTGPYLFAEGTAAF